MNPLPDPFTPLNSETITRLYHKRLEPFTVKGDVKQIFQEHKEGKHPGKIEQWKTSPKKTNGHVVFKPETIEGLEKWNEAHDYHYRLCVLQSLQFRYIETLQLADKSEEKRSQANEIKAEIITLYNSLFGEPEPPKTEIEKPLLTGKTLETVFSILKDYFSETDQIHFKRFLAGVKLPEPIIFNSDGIRLTDAFKKLSVGNFIAGWKKTEIQDFIRENIKFVHQKEDREFKAKTLDMYISGDREAQFPLIDIVSGQIVKSEKPNKRKENHRF